MRHAILGAGGIGGLLAAALAKAGMPTVVLIRPEALADYSGRIAVESVVLGVFESEVPAASKLDREIDVLWVATKATQLESALGLAPPDRVGVDGIVIPLLNGIDHVDVLRARYPTVVAGAIRVESERISLGRIRQSSPFLHVDLSGGERVAADLRTAGIDCRVSDEELTLLWEKLAFLAPVALATTALDAPLGAVRDDERFRGCQREALAVAGAEGARVNVAGLLSVVEAAPAEMRSSMQKDVAAGREPELDAIAGPILRGSDRHGLPAPYTKELGRLVAARASVETNTFRRALRTQRP